MGSSSSGSGGLIRDDRDLADHARLVVAGDQAGEIEVAGPVEGPDDLAGLPGGDVGHVGLVVLHVRKLGHQLGVLFEFLLGADHDLVQLLAIVADDEADGLAPRTVMRVGVKRMRRPS